MGATQPCSHACVLLSSVGSVSQCHRQERLRVYPWGCLAVQESLEEEMAPPGSSLREVVGSV